MIVEAAELEEPSAGMHQPGSLPSGRLANTARAKASAAGLLGEESGNYCLYAALGWALSLAGQHKVSAPQHLMWLASNHCVPLASLLRMVIEPLLTWM